MFRALPAVIFLIFLRVSPGAPARPLESSGPGGVLRQLSFASFTGSGNSVQAIGADAHGNVYVTGTTSSPGFPVKNAAQPNFGEARILLTTDLGATWTRVGSPPQDVSMVVSDPVAPQVLFAAGSSAIYKSADSGRTWRTVYGSPSHFGLQYSAYSVGYSTGIVIDPGNHLRLAALAPSTGILIRSLDGGETWTAAPNTPCFESRCGGNLFADPTGSGALLLAIQALYVSRDWGVTFQPVRPPGIGNVSAVAFDPSHPGWIYVDIAVGVPGTLSLSMDFGATWSIKASPPTTFSQIVQLAVDPGQPNTLVAAALDGLYKSTDGAASWTRQAGPGARFSPETAPGMPDTFALVSHSCTPGGGLFAIGSGGGIFGFQVAFSSDDGATWATPQLTNITGVTAGPGCAVYVTRHTSSDAFLAKVAPDGSTVWATYLGGSDQDAPVNLVLDTQGNVYVTGNTTSPDFPSTAPRIGPPGQSSVFVTKFSADGKLAYSVLISGEAANYASALAIDPSQNIFVVGRTDSLSFPVTQSAFAAKLDVGSYTGFLVKLAPDASLAYATYLGPSYSYPGVIVVDPNQAPIVAGSGPAPGLPPPQQGSTPGFLLKLDPATLQVVSAMYLGAGLSGAPAALATYGDHNLYLAGPTGFPVTPGTYSSPKSSAACDSTGFPYISGSGVYVMKLAAADWTPIYSALLTAPCGMQAGAMAVDSAGAVTLALTSGNGLPLHNPLLAGPTCGLNSSAAARISPDGSALQFATYLDNCGLPGIALAPDDSIYAGVSPSRNQNPAGILRLNASVAPAISLDGIANAFSGDNSAVVGGGLYSLTGVGFGAPTIDLGLNASRDLPFQLGGLQVIFDGIPAAILQTSPNGLIVVPPSSLPALTRGSPNPTGYNSSFAAPQMAFTSVQLVRNGIPSNTVWMPVSTLLPGLLSLDYPNPHPNPNYGNYPDGNVLNQDGTRNDTNHPAPAGSTITVYATGMGATNPPVASGSIARSDKIVPVAPVYSSWIEAGPFTTAPPQIASSLAGFVSALFQIRIQVPDSLQYLGGTDLGNGVQRVSIGLRLRYPVSPEIPIGSNVVGVYLK